MAASDKNAGVVALTLMDLRRRGRVGRLALCGVDGTKFPAIRAHMWKAIGAAYKGLDCSCETFPADDKRDGASYQSAARRFQPGDCATVFTPDDTHFEITKALVLQGLHVLTTKPLVKTLAEHRELARLARDKGVLVMVEVHKRFDPIYADARDRSASLGAFSYFAAYMSQPKSQLATFKSWAGRSSDISYYLNSHHVDFSEWLLEGRARPTRVTAQASTGVASKVVDAGAACEDTITLLVQWENREDASLGTAVYTSSWIAPRAEVHSQQRFFYMGHKGEMRVDQAHRGFEIATDDHGYASCNPLFMKYTPNATGEFAGQLGYGYRSIEAFVEAVRELNAGARTLDELSRSLPTVDTTMLTTAVLEAGRVSLDNDSMPVAIVYDSQSWGEPLRCELLKPHDAQAQAQAHAQAQQNS